MSTAYRNVQPGDELGGRSYYRVTFTKDWRAITDANFRIGMQQVIARIGGEDWITYVQLPTFAPGDTAAVLDVRIADAGARRTAASLVQFLDDATYLTDVARVEKIPVYLPAGDAADRAAAARDDVATDAAKQLATTSPLAQLTGGLNKLFLLAALVAALLFWRELRGLMGR